MGHTILGRTQANWTISIVDGYFRISKHLAEYIPEDIQNKFIILWAWQTRSRLEKIKKSALNTDVYFLTDKSKAEIIGCGRWLKELGNIDLSEYWKDQPQWNKKWEFPYLIEIKELDSRFFEKVKNLSEQERLTIVNDKKINKRELFTNLNLNKITDPHGGASWETIDSVQEND